MFRRLNMLYKKRDKIKYLHRETEESINLCACYRNMAIERFVYSTEEFEEYWQKADLEATKANNLLEESNKLLKEMENGNYK